MAKKYLDYDGLVYFWTKIKTYFTGTATPKMDSTAATGTSSKFAREDHVHPSDSTKVDKVSGKGLSANDYTTAEKNKLAGIAAGAEVNQNAFSNVTVGSTTIAADGKTDTLTIVAGSNVTLTPDATNDKLTIAATDTTYSAATTSAAGLMSASDKTKLNGIADGAEVNVQPDWNQTDDTADDYIKNKPTVTNGNGLTMSASGVISMAAASTSAAGAMSSSDKTKLNGIATGAEVNQNAFSNVKVGSTTVAADAKTDTLELVAGSNVTLTPDATNDKVTIAATDTTYSNATPSAAGLMSADDKAALDSIVAPPAGNANKVWRTNSSGTAFWGTLTASDVGAVPTSRTVNGKALSSNITLSASDVSAIPTSAKGTASGVCPLNASSKIDATYLPSYVDDVIEAYARSGQTALSSTWLATGSASGTVITPETGKIYILMADSGDYSTNDQFRWSGTTYVKMADGGVSAITNSEIDTIMAA